MDKEKIIKNVLNEFDILQRSQSWFSINKITIRIKNETGKMNSNINVETKKMKKWLRIKIEEVIDLINKKNYD